MFGLPRFPILRCTAHETNLTFYNTIIPLSDTSKDTTSFLPVGFIPLAASYVQSISLSTTSVHCHGFTCKQPSMWRKTECGIALFGRSCLFLNLSLTTITTTSHQVLIETKFMRHRSTDIEALPCLRIIRSTRARGKLPWGWLVDNSRLSSTLRSLPMLYDFSLLRLPILTAIHGSSTLSVWIRQV